MIADLLSDVIGGSHGGHDDQGLSGEHIKRITECIEEFVESVGENVKTV